MSLSVLFPEHKKKYTARSGTSLLSLMQQHHIDLAAPCGGKKTCRKCQVEVAGLGPVLACDLILDESLWQRLNLPGDAPLVVHVPRLPETLIESDAIAPRAHVNPLACRARVTLPAPSMADLRPDDQRFYEATGNLVPLHLLNELAQRIADRPEVIYYDFRTDDMTVVRFVGDDETPILGCAVDIGTTTLAAYLFDLLTGRQLGRLSRQNPQKLYGADVISRIEYASAGPEQLRDLQLALNEAISGMINDLVTQAGYPDCADCLVVTLAGNTTMTHLLCGLQPRRLAMAPFIPVSLRGIIVPAATIGLMITPVTLAVVLPAIACYVGSDLSAGILACDLMNPDLTVETMKKALPGTVRILLDIGTNGEIVLAGPHGLIACATAAGPAFEGANIACGMPALPGAVDQVNWDGSTLTVSVIGGEGSPIIARGICGSGLVALVASLLDAGIIDETGRIVDCDELEETGAAVSLALRQAIGTVGPQSAFFLDAFLAQTASNRSGQVHFPASRQADSSGGRVYLAQKDVRELQNAKAAIAAGLAILIEESGVTDWEAFALELAGGFGNYLNVAQAIRIGLIPAELCGKVRPVGNTSGLGASLCLLDHANFRKTEQIASQVRYLDLSGNPRFNDLYIEAMLFPELD